MIKPSFFQDHSQNFWQLASIQAASVGFSGLVLGGQLASKFGSPTALLSIIFGNLILWVIGMGMISMSSSQKNPVFENVTQYLGKKAATISSIILITAFIIWFVVQIELSTLTINKILQHQPISKKLVLITGTGTGLLISLLSMGGIRFIKWICTIGFILLIGYVIYIFAYLEHTIIFNGGWELSINAISSTIAASLVGMINLPTFFKHSRSKSDSYIGLTLMTIFTTLLQSSSIILRFDVLNPRLISFIKTDFNYYFTILFAVTSLICINIVNIYFASAGVKLFISRLSKRFQNQINEYLIIGLAGTILFALVQVSSPMILLVNLAADFLANLGIVLTIAFLTSITMKHRKIKFGKFVNSTSWFIGCTASLIAQIRHPEDLSVAFMWGISCSLLAFLMAAFIAETTWSIKAIQSKNAGKRA